MASDHNVKNFTPEEIDRGIKKLRRRVEEVKALDPVNVPYNDALVTVIESNIKDTVGEVFGPSSPELNDLPWPIIWKGGIGTLEEFGVSQEKFAAGIPETVTLLEGFIARLEEKREFLEDDPKAHAKASFEGLDLHPEIAGVTTKLYNDSHYTEAVRNASMALINMVKEKSERHDLDGAKLMFHVFSKNNPILAFNNLQTRSDKDEQEGMMHLYAGAVLAIRNPRAHDFYFDSPGRALEYIGLLSMLANRLDEAKLQK